MDILPYLTALLKTQKEVSLNGFGTFFKTRVPGRYDEQSQSYLPPFYTLNFKQEDASDDQLASYINENRHLSLNTINYYIGEYVAGLNQALTENAEINLPGIGKLKQGELDLIFEADAGADLGQDFFGLQPVSALPAVNDGNADESPGETEAADEIIPAANENLSETTHQVIETPEVEYSEEHNETENVAENGEDFTTEDEPGGRPAYIKWLIISFIVIVLAAVLLMLKPSFYKEIFKNTTDTTSAAFDKEKLKNKADTLNADTTLTNKIKDILIDSLNTANPVNADSTTFEIFAVGGVKTEKQANIYIDRYNKMGFKAKAFHRKLMINISVASFKTEAEALDSLPAVRKRLKDDGIYVKEEKIK